ncbi:hypothetical protein Z962_p0036 (plasmid) [Clostridium botulinum C/D str. BKT12695]|nr:hypothetical protein Z962_p0036 [Clostridium botulinum C/D str. BKT12695]
MTNKEKALLTYELLQKRKREGEKQAERDFMAHTIGSIAKTYKRNNKGKRWGEI